MDQFIPVVTKQYCRKVDLSEILYIEQWQRRLNIVTAEESYVCYLKIDNIREILDERFYPTLKKLVVNLEQILEIRDQNILFQNGTRLILSRESYIRTKQTFAAYLKKLL
jgi:DNA-binding LytR/AlgR family response regulator